MSFKEEAKMKESRYLTRFKRLASEGQDAYVLNGDFILVEAIPEDELKTKSGLIIATARANTQHGSIAEQKPNWVRVLAVGAGYYSQETDDDGTIVEKTVPLDVEVGDIVLLPRISIHYFSVFGLEGYEADSIGISKASEIQLRFHGQEGYERAFRCLSVSPEEKVAESSGG
jgi:co-chaperonin GroES (HSP10)